METIVTANINIHNNLKFACLQLVNDYRVILAQFLILSTFEL